MLNKHEHRKEGTISIIITLKEKENVTEDYIKRDVKLEKKLVRKMIKICEKKHISLNRLIDLYINFAMKEVELAINKTKLYE
jgi:hypothetical protein